MDRQPVVGFAGMTHLGIVSAVAVAANGFETICYDPDATRTGELSRGVLPVLEPGLDDLTQKHKNRQTFTSVLQDLSACDLVYISADVPTDDQARSNLENINALINETLTVMAPDALLIVLCQVPPGFTRSITRDKTRLYYQVETLVFGRAVERAMHPERYIIGCADPDAPIDPRFDTLLQAFNCPVLPMRYESAELAKIAINCCLVASIGIANSLAELCENIGANWGEIAPALRLDARIGPKAYLTPGLGIAGGNLERDLVSVINMAHAHETDAGIISALISNSLHRQKWAAQTLRAHLHDMMQQPDGKPTIAIWGLAYKENTHSIKNSPSIATIAELPDMKILVHDPAVPADVVDHVDITAINSPLERLDEADALMILTPWPHYRELAPAQIARQLKGRLLIDPYSVLDRKAAIAAGLRYFTLGVAPEIET